MHDGTDEASCAELRTLVTDAELELIAWNDLTGPSARMMHTVLNAPPHPLGLHVYVPDFVAKATNLIDNLDHERARLIQACCARSEGPPVITSPTRDKSGRTANAGR